MGIIEQHGTYVRIMAKGKAGPIEILADMTKEGDTLILKGVSMQGQGPKTAGMGELGAIFRQVGRQQGVKEVVIHGTARSTGKHIGEIPRPVTLKVD